MNFTWQFVKKGIFNKNNIQGVLLMGAVLLSLYLQSNVTKLQYSEYFEASVLIQQDRAIEAYPANKNYKFITLGGQPDVYFSGGETEKDIYRFGLQAYGQSLQFDGMKLHVDGIVSNNSFKEFGLYEMQINDDGTVNEFLHSKGRINNKKLVFSGFNSNIGSNAEKEYLIKGSTQDAPEIGDRFTLNIVSPDDLSVKINERRIDTLARYPLESPHITVVGYWR